MTKLLYLDDAYLTECDATITDVLPNGVVLDQSVFYCQGGGQVGDTGSLTINGTNYPVTDTKKENGLHVHLIASTQGLEKGMKVHGIIDWEKRYNLMRMHTSAHVLAGVIFNETGKLITGNQLGPDQSRMDFEVESFTPEFLQMIEKKTNDVLAQNLDITVKYLPKEEALQIPSLFRLKDVLPKNLEIFRIVSIGTFDVQADGGTHPHNTKEVGKIKIGKTENKGAQNRRMYWALDK